MTFFKTSGDLKQQKFLSISSGGEKCVIFFQAFQKVFSDENSSARSWNVVYNPKNFTVGSPLTSGKGSLQIFGQKMCSRHGNVIKKDSKPVSI